MSDSTTKNLKKNQLKNILKQYPQNQQQAFVIQRNQNTKSRQLPYQNVLQKRHMNEINKPIEIQVKKKDVFTQETIIKQNPATGILKNPNDNLYSQKYYEELNEQIQKFWIRDEKIQNRIDRVDDQITIKEKEIQNINNDLKEIENLIEFQKQKQRDLMKAIYSDKIQDIQTIVQEQNQNIEQKQINEKITSNQQKIYDCVQSKGDFIFDDKPKQVIGITKVDQNNRVREFLIEFYPRDDGFCPEPNIFTFDQLQQNSFDFLLDYYIKHAKFQGKDF